MPLVYIDESGFESDTARSHSYSRKGTRAESTFNWQLKNSCNAIGALINHKLLTVGLFECTITTEVFEGWVEHDLLPKLKKKSVLIMDNASFHKGQKLQELLKKAGHYLVWLPKYSPDLNPIEKMWSRVKSVRKKFRVADIDKLFKDHCGDLFSI